MTGHKHAALMLQYAQDAAETAEPWTRWQVRNPQNQTMDWSSFVAHPSWMTDLEYRRKPRTIRIGEFDVPEPMREAPQLNTRVYFVNLAAACEGVSQTHWLGETMGLRLLKRGLMYLDEQSADLCARAFLSLLEPRK